MHLNSIKVYARLKYESKFKQNKVEVTKAKDQYKDILFFSGESPKPIGVTKFRFSDIFEYNITQNQIFDTVAKPVVESVLQGFNGTILAYGQTGSGKTYTMTGSPKEYSRRGVTPRCLQYIFSAIEKVEEKPIICISYIEIYNEKCYDLLCPRESKIGRRLEELPRVLVFEDKKGEPYLRNISVLPVTTEEEAMRLMFLGDTNRVIAETPLNEYSSRSHCIFTVYIKSSCNKARSSLCSKLNLVDLAGSERVHKSNISGSILHEAKHINISLHFLQQVIVALSQSNRTHIPYRNSLMTFVLKDALGGNCLTVMIATLSLDKNNLQYLKKNFGCVTASTQVRGPTEKLPLRIQQCVFSKELLNGTVWIHITKQKPSVLANLLYCNLLFNELWDPHQEIQYLREENLKLRMELANRRQSSKTIQDKMPSSKKHLQGLEAKLKLYLQSEDDLSKADISAEDFEYSLSYMKQTIRNLLKPLNENIEFPYLTKGINLGRKGTPTEKPSFINIPKIQSEYEKVNPERLDNKLMMKSELDYYITHLTSTYKKAKLVSSTIEECEVNINYIKEKLNLAAKSNNIPNRFLFSRELENQQQFYKKCLLDLRKLKSESLQLEAGFEKAKTRLAMSSLDTISDTNCSINEGIDFAVKANLINDCCHQELSPNILCGLNNLKSSSHFTRETTKDFNSRSLVPSVNSIQTNGRCFKCVLVPTCSTSTQNWHEVCNDNKDDPYNSHNVKLPQFATDCLELTNVIPEVQHVRENTLSKGDSCSLESERKKPSYEAIGCFCQSEVKSSQLLERTNSDLQMLPSKLPPSKVHSPKTTEEVTSSHYEGATNSKSEKDIKHEPTNAIFLKTDNETFRSFIAGISLTGDEEIDKEICNFYRRNWRQ